MKRRKMRRVRRNPTKLDFSMAKAGDKYIGEMEFQKKGGDFDVWTVIKRGRIYLIGTTTNTGLLSDYYYKMEAGESEQNALQEINDDLEVLARDGESYMSSVKKIPRKISSNRRRKLRGNPGHSRPVYWKANDIITKDHEYYDDVHYIWRPVPSFWIGDFVNSHSHNIFKFKDMVRPKTGKNLRGNPSGVPRQKAPRYSKTLPNKFYKIYWSHHARGDTAALIFKGDKIIKISMSELSRFWPTNEGLKMERLHVLGPFDSWDQAFASQK